MSTPSEATRDHKAMALPGDTRRKAKPKKHYMRNIFLIMILLAAVILWQLNPIINALGTVQHALTHAEGTRAVFASILSSLYDKIQQVAGPLFKHL